MSCQVFSLQHKHILFDQELLADRIAVLCPQTISKTLGDLPRNPVENLKSIPEWMLNIIDPVYVAQYASSSVTNITLQVSMSQGLQSLLGWHIILSSGYWPMTGLDCHKLSNQEPDNRDCYCVVSRSLCSIKLMSPRLSNVWPRKKQHKNTSGRGKFNLFGKTLSRHQRRLRLG